MAEAIEATSEGGRVSGENWVFLRSNLNDIVCTFSK